MFTQSLREHQGDFLNDVKAFLVDLKGFQKTSEGFTEV